MIFQYESIFIQLRDRALMRHITSLQLDINFSEGLNFSIRNFSSASDNPLAVARSSISPVFIRTDHVGIYIKSDYYW